MLLVHLQGRKESSLSLLFALTSILVLHQTIRNRMLNLWLTILFSFIATVFCKERHAQNLKMTILHTVDVLITGQSGDLVVIIAKHGQYVYFTI